MFGIGKNTAWDARLTFPQATDTFFAITQDPTSLTLDSLHMRYLEHWIILLMYSESYNADSLNEVHVYQWPEGPQLNPPTQHAFIEHAKRTLLIAAYVWKQNP